MLSKNNNYIAKNIEYIILFIFSVFVYAYLVKYVYTDIRAHVDKVISINENQSSYPGNFLFYFFVNLFSGFTNNKYLMLGVAILMLSLATVCKYFLSKLVIQNLNISINKNKNIYLILIGLFFCFAIPDPYSVFVLKKMYLGKIVPTVWHNSTTILLFPFAILLFWKQVEVLGKHNKTTLKQILIINILVILNIIIKPSFIITYIPITFLFLLYKMKTLSMRKFILNLTPLITGTLIILTQYIYIYITQKGLFQSEPSQVSFSLPFEVFSVFIPIWFIPISFFLSLMLPIFTMILYKEILKYKPFNYALCLTIFGLLISIFIKETGPRFGHGNFLWQNVICSFLLFLSTLSFLAPKFLNKKTKSKKTKLLMVIFFIHGFSGILYLLKIFLTKSYH
jgi:hypothetical protein